MSAPKMSKPIPKPRPRASCTWPMGNLTPSRLCPETDTVVIRTGHREPHRLCRPHQDALIQVLVGGKEAEWAIRQIIRQEIERA